MSTLYDESAELKKGFIFKNRYRIFEELRSGGQARVFVVEDMNSSYKKKVIKMVESVEHKDVKNEIDLLKKLNNKSDYLINYFDDFPFFSIKHCIVTEFYKNKDLASELERYKMQNLKIKDHKIEYWNMEIIEGLCFLHENGIIHRDIKPQNIFVTEKDDLKIGDLGYSKKAVDIVSKSRTVGTLNYMSPELLNNENYDERIDTWAYGCVLYEMIFLRKLFQNPSDFKLIKEIVEKDIEIPKTNELYSFILRRTIEKEIKDRAYIKDIKLIINNKKKIIEETLLNKNKIISGSSDGSIKIWDVDSGSCLKTFTGHSMGVGCIRVMDKNKIISGSDDESIKVSDIENGRCIKTLIGHSNWVNCITVMDRNIIISGSSDGSIKVWDIASGNCITTLTAHSDWVNCITVLDKNRIISGSRDKTIKVWDVESRSCIKTLTGHLKWVLCITVMDRNKIISGSSDGSIKVWDLESCSCITTLPGDSNWVLCITVLDKNKIISGCEDNSIKIWDIDSGSCIKTLTGHSNWVNCITVLDKNKIVSGSDDRSIKIWNIESGSCIKTLTEHWLGVLCITVME